MSTATIPVPVEERHFMRFNPRQRFLHIVLAITFLLLAATGLPLKFSASVYSVRFAAAVGGFSAILFIHKFSALVLSAAFAAHVFEIAYGVIFQKKWWMLWGPKSMVPNLKDLQDLIAQMKYFMFMGKKPKFDRFTYWEKMDYWGVFWGMAIIGLSGYAMWFAPVFAKLIPGSWLNIALLIHGEEALLATGFIFVVHFFNEHLRPNNFPMDMTIFTGTHTEEEFKDRHPEEYARMVETGELEKLRAPAPQASFERSARIFGAIAVGTGLLLMVFIVQAFLKD